MTEDPDNSGILYYFWQKTKMIIIDNRLCMFVYYIKKKTHYNPCFYHVRNVYLMYIKK